MAVAWLLFLLSGTAAIYILFLYPLLLALLARWRPWPVHKQFEPRTVSIIVAVRNGEPFVEAKLRSLLALDYPRNLLEIIVVSDGSDDGTDELVRSFAAEGVLLLSVPRGGKCAALNAAISRAGHDILLLTDIRQVVEPSSLRQLVACFADERVGVVSGSLLVRRGDTQETLDVGLYWRFESWLRERLSTVDSMLGATGPFYAMRRRLAVPLPPECLLDDMYLPLAAMFKGYRLIVEPTATAYDYPTSLHTEFRRKVRTLAGNYQLLGYYPQLLLPSNRLWLHYISYKFGRLILPYLLISFLLSSAFVFWPLFAAQCAFYLLAWVDRFMPQGTPPKRLTSPVRTFVTMMLAAACGISILFVRPRTLWKETRVQKVA